MADLYAFFAGNFLSMYFFSCIGALVLWMKSTAKSKQSHSLGDVVDLIFPKSERFGAIVKFLIFIFFGGFIGVLLVGPLTAVQAMSAGVAWSRLAAKD